MSESTQSVSTAGPVTKGRVWWCCSLSFAAVWLWCCIISRADLFSNISTGGIFFATLRFPSLISNVAALAIIVLVANRIRSVLNVQPVFTVVAACFALGSALLFAGQMLNQFSLSVVGITLGGACISILKIAWGEMFSRIGLRSGLASMGYALVISVAIFLVTCQLPAALSWLLLIISSAICPLLLAQGRHFAIETNETTTDRQTQPIKWQWTFLVLPVLVASTCGLSFGMTANEAILENVGFNSIAISSAVGQGIVGIVLLLISKFLSPRLGAAQIYAGALIFVIIGYLMLALDMPLLWISNGFTSMGYHAFYFFMVVYWGDLAKRTGRSVVVTYATSYFAFQFAHFIGYITDFFVVQRFESEAIVMLTVSIVFVFFVAALFLYGGYNSSVRLWLLNDGIQETPNEVSEACTAIASRSGLSPREHEILMLLARGRNADYIARVLYIAPSTVKTHIKSIYRKLDIHSQQNLMDIIESEH
jgi:DNA-binding CsgD family transcriptional regulator